MHGQTKIKLTKLCFDSAENNPILDMNVPLSNISVNHTVFNLEFSTRQGVLELQLFGHKVISFLGVHN